MSKDQPKGEMVEIKGQPEAHYGTKDPQRDYGHITGQDPKPGGKS